MSRIGINSQNILQIHHGISERTFPETAEQLLFSDLEKKVNLFRVTHPKADIIRLGTGDVTLPLPRACIEAMHKAVEEMSDATTFHGYGPEEGYHFLINEIIKTITLHGEYIWNPEKYSSATAARVTQEVSAIFYAMTTASE